MSRVVIRKFVGGATLEQDVNLERLTDRERPLALLITRHRFFAGVSPTRNIGPFPDGPGARPAVQRQQSFGANRAGGRTPGPGPWGAWGKVHARIESLRGLGRCPNPVRRRTRVATIFPNENSLLRLVSAVLVEVSDGWETDRVYLTMGEER